jgi:hypothetical protein
LTLRVKGRTEKGQWYEKCYSPSSAHDCPEFLKEQISDDLEFIATRIVTKCNKRIAELEKEFDSL